MSQDFSSQSVTNSFGGMPSTAGLSTAYLNDPYDLIKGDSAFFLGDAGEDAASSSRNYDFLQEELEGGVLTTHSNKANPNHEPEDPFATSALAGMIEYRTYTKYATHGRDDMVEVDDDDNANNNNNSKDANHTSSFYDPVTGTYDYSYRPNMFSDATAAMDIDGDNATAAGEMMRTAVGPEGGILDIPPLDGRPSLMVIGDNGVVRWVTTTNLSADKKGRPRAKTRLVEGEDGGYDVIVAVDDIPVGSSAIDDDDDDDANADEEFAALTSLIQRGAYAASSTSISEQQRSFSAIPQIISLEGIDLAALAADATIRAKRVRNEMEEKAREREAAALADEENKKRAIEDVVAEHQHQYSKKKRDPMVSGGEGDVSTATTTTAVSDNATSYSSYNTSDTALWTSKYAPHSFVELLSDEDSNLALLQWMKSWDPFVFRPRGTANNIPTLSGENEGQFMQFGKEVGSTATKSEKQQKPFGSSKTSTQAPSSSAAAAELLNGTAANNKAAIPARPMQRITLITGPPGAGKTTMAHIIAAHCGYDAIEVNASVDRTISTLERLISSTVADMHFVSSGMPSQKPTAGATKRGRDANGAENSHSTIKPMGLISRPRCLIIDEMDGVVANVTQLLLKHDINRPVICLANDLYAPALRDLRAVSSPLILSGSLNTFNAMMVGIMQLPPIRPQRLLHRLQIVLRKQEDEDELSYRRGLQRQQAQAAAALQNRQTADQQALSSLNGSSATSLSLAATSSPAWNDSTRANTPATSQQQPLSSLQARISAAASTSGNSSASPLFSNNSAPVYQSSFAHIKKHKIPLTDVLGQPLLAELVHVSNGDVRTCLNTLQFLCSSILGNNNKSVSTNVQASLHDASANNNKSSDSSKPISSTALQRMFIDVCKKDSVMSTWSLWQQLFLRIEKSKYLQMIEKALPSGQAQEGADNASNPESANATQRPSTTAPQQHAGNSEGSIYKDYIAREDAKRAQAKLQQYKKQQEAREAEQSKMLAIAEAEQNRLQLGSSGHSDHNASKAPAPPVEFPVLFSVPNAIYDPGFIYLVQHVLPLSGSQGASNSAGAGGGAMGALDMGLVLEGCYEQYPRQRYPDYNMRKTSFCSAAFSFHDLLSSQAFSGGGGGSLINLAEQFSMITAATCFVCCSSLSKADNKMQFPRMEANYRLCLKTAESVAKSFCEGGSIGPAADKANPNTTFTANRDRLNSSTTFGLHSASTIATEVAPYMCRSLLPPSAIKVPRNFSDPTRNLHAKDLENWEASVRRHAFYGLTYRPVRLPVGVNADGTSLTGLQPAFGPISGHSGGPGSSAPGAAGGGGGFGNGFSKMSEQHGYWALEPAIDRFCLSALASGATRAPVQQPRTSNFYNKDGTKNTNFNKNDDAFNKPYTTIASASKSGTKSEGNATTVTTIPSSSYTLALTQPSYNPNAAIVTKGILISRGDVRQMLVGEIGREKIRLQRAAHEQHLASLQQRQAQNPIVSSTMAAPLLDEHGFQLPAVKMERTLLFGGSSASSPPRPQTAAVAPKQQEQAPPVPVVLSAPATVKVKKDFFGRPIVPKSIAPATRPATPAVEGSSADPSSAPTDAPAVAVSGVNKVKAAEMAMALKYPSCMRFTYYDGSTVGVKRPANMADFIQ